MTGCRRVHLPVAWAFSRDQVMAPPTLMTPPTLLLSFPLSLSLLFCSLLLSSILFPTWLHKRLSKHDLSFHITSDLHRRVGATSAVLFRDRASTRIIPLKMVQETTSGKRTTGLRADTINEAAKQRGESFTEAEPGDTRAISKPKKKTQGGVIN